VEECIPPLKSSHPSQRKRYQEVFWLKSNVFGKTYVISAL